MGVEGPGDRLVRGQLIKIVFGRGDKVITRSDVTGFYLAQVMPFFFLKNILGLQF